MKIKVKPWTDDRGRLLSDDELRIQSKNWSIETWEEYLSTVESKSSGCFYNPEIYDGYCDEMLESIFAVVTNERNLTIKEKIEASLSELPERQQAVLRLLYWEGRSQNQIAKEWGIQQSSVFNLKQRALTNLKISLEKLQGAVNSPFMRGQENSSDLISTAIESDIAEVMNSEINRNATHESFWRSCK